MNQVSDDDLRARFDALRHRDTLGAPAFHAVLDHQSYAARRRGPRWILLSVAAAASIIIALGIVISSHSPRHFAAQSLSEWRSPTASLLQSPSYELMLQQPVTHSVLDGVSTLRATRGGTHQ